MSTIKASLVKAGTELLASSDSPAADASILLCRILHCPASHLLAWPGQELETDQQQLFEELIRQRAKGTPVAYLTGEKEFWSLPFTVTPDVLIPRPETETLVEFILQQFGNTDQLKLVDLGTGCGAIACALAHEKPAWQITATDLYETALDIAHMNARLLGVENIRFRHGNWLDAVDGECFDIIVSNPPYVADGDPHLVETDIRHEPVSALASGADGMDDIRRIAAGSASHLNADGWLIVEHGYDQRQAVLQVFTGAGFINTVQASDLAGNPRMTAGQVP